MGNSGVYSYPCSRVGVYVGSDIPNPDPYPPNPYPRTPGVSETLAQHYIGCTDWEYNFSVILPFGLGGSLCILGTTYINWEVTAAGSILAHGKAGWL